MTVTDLEQFMEQRVFDVRGLEIISMNGSSEKAVAPVVVFQHAGIDIVMVPDWTPGTLLVEVRCYIDGVLVATPSTLTISR